MGLQRFEQGLERMVEGVFSRSSRSSIRPVELGRRLLREMDDHRAVDAKGRRIVPNSFTFHLSAKDHSGFAQMEDALVAELAEAARQYAADEGYHLLGPISVALLVDNNLKAGRFGIASVVREAVHQSSRPVFPPSDAPPAEQRHTPPPAEPAVPPREAEIAVPEASIADLLAGIDDLPGTGAAAGAAAGAALGGTALGGAAGAAAAAAPAAGAAGDPDDAELDAAVARFPPGSTEPRDAAAPDPDDLTSLRGELVLPSGQRVPITGTPVTIGRLPECELTLNDQNVSRRHAQVRTHGTAVADLGSTNGTKINGRRIDGEQRLSDGDIVSVGASHLRFEAR
jgi:hypothetical protein